MLEMLENLAPCAFLRPKVFEISVGAWFTAGLRSTSSSISSGSVPSCSCVVLQLTCLSVLEVFGGTLAYMVAAPR